MKKLLPAETASLSARLWMRWAGLGPLGRTVCAIAALGQPPSYGISLHTTLRVSGNML